MSNTEDTLDEIPIESAAIEMMLAHMVQCEQVFNIARPHLHPEQFNGMFEVAYFYIWAVTLEHYERYQELPSKQILSSTVIAYMQRDATVPPDMLNDANSLIEWLWSEWEGNFSPDPAIKVVQAFLMDRKVKKQLDNLRIYGQSIPEVLQSLQDDTAVIAQIGNEDLTPTVGDIFPEYEQRVDQFRGHEMMGFRTGMQFLDERTCGLRGMTILGAGPGVGKTVYALQIATGICRHADVNDAAVLYLSLDMPRDDILDRLVCSVAGIDWRTYRLGTTERGEATNGRVLTPAQEERIADAKQLLRSEGVFDHLAIVGRDDVGNLSAAGIISLLRSVMARNGARRFLLVIDYIQLLPIPDEIAKRSDLEADRARLRIVQQVLDEIGQDNEPNGALVISEARKLQTSTSRDRWGHKIEDLMGSARLAYAADAILMMRRLEDVEDLQRIYDATDASGLLEQFESEGVCPLEITLAKGRDGMTRGSWPAEFHYRLSRITEGRGTRPPLTPSLAGCHR